MNSIRIIPYQPGHLDVMEIRDIHRQREDVEAALRVLHANPSAHLATLLIGNEVMAIVGLVKLHDGLAEVSAVTSPLVSVIPLGFTKMCRGLIASYMRDLSLHRVQLYVRTDYKAGVRWAGVLGFQQEAHLRAYGPERQNFYLFARFKNG